MMDKTAILVGGPILAREDQFWLPKLVRPDQFWQQKLVWGTSFGRFSAKIGPVGQILGGTNFGVTGHLITCTFIL